MVERVYAGDAYVLVERVHVCDAAYVWVERVHVCDDAYVLCENSTCMHALLVGWKIKGQGDIQCIAVCWCCFVEGEGNGKMLGPMRVR
jgi:hypothetical protein